MSRLNETDLNYTTDTYGFTEDLTEDNFYVPAEAEYEDFGEESEEWDIAEAKPGLWENIRKKKEREGKNYKPAKKGDPDRPDPDSWKKAQNGFKYENPKTGEEFTYKRRGVYKKDNTTLIYKGKAAEYQEERIRFEQQKRLTAIDAHFAARGRHVIQGEGGRQLLSAFHDGRGVQASMMKRD